MHDTVSAQSLPVVSREQVRRDLNGGLSNPPSTARELAQAAPERRAGRGRPIELQPPHLWLGPPGGGTRLPRPGSLPGDPSFGPLCPGEPDRQRARPTLAAGGLRAVTDPVLPAMYLAAGRARASCLAAPSLSQPHHRLR